MDKYLLEILKEVNTIIIPGLGALTITDADKGEIMFMPYLKHDDGELSKYIAEKEGMEINDAVNLIAKYVREILSTLDKGESYDMYQFGSFFKNDSGDIEFKVWSSESSGDESTNKVDESIELESAEEEESKTEEVIEVIEEIEEKNTPLENNPVEEPNTETEKEVEKPEDPIPVIDPQPEQGEPDPVIPVIITPPVEPKKELNILEKEERAATQARLDKLKEEKSKPVKKKRGAVFYALIVFGLIIISFSSYVIIDFEGASRLMPFLASDDTHDSEENNALEEMAEILGNTEEQIAEQTDTILSSMESQDEENIEVVEVKNEEPVIEEVRKEPKEVKVAVTPSPTNSSTGYHIIAGSFGNPENAERFAAKLKSEGANAFVIQENGLSKVSLGSYGSRAEAKQALAGLNLSVNPIIHKVD